MQIQLKLIPEKPLTIPLNYSYQLQSAIYAMLREAGASDFWHDNGFGDTAKFKGFCFGKLEGKYRIDRENKKICFEGTVSLEVRSSVFEFIDLFQRAVEIHPFIRLYDTRLDISSAALTNIHLGGATTVFEAVTPVVIHETYSDGKTHFFSPDENEYFIGICNNIIKKYESVTGTAADNVNICPKGEFIKTVTKYKDFYITGYTGKIAVKSSVKMLEFIYNNGLGEKNSQGFGFVKC